MSEKHNLGRPAQDEEFDLDNFPEKQMEAQPGVFEAGQRRINGPVPELHDTPGEDLIRYGDSRPDQTNPDSAHFDDISEDPRMKTMREPDGTPEVHREDAEMLGERRVDQKDGWVAEPTGIDYSKEEVVIRPRVVSNEDESEES